MASDVHRIVPSRPMTCAETSVHSSGKIGGSSLTPLPHRKPASAPKRSQMIVDFATKPPPVSLEVAGRACRSGNEFNGLPFFLFSFAFGGREVGSRLKITDRAAANGLAFVDEERRFLVHDIVDRYDRTDYWATPSGVGFWVTKRSSGADLAALR